MKNKLLQRSKTNKSKKQEQNRKYRRLEARKRFQREMWLIRHPKKEETKENENE